MSIKFKPFAKQHLRKAGLTFRGCLLVSGRMSQTSVKVISRKTIFEGFHDLEECVLQYTLDDAGTWSSHVHREVFHTGDVVSIIMYNPEKNQLLLTEQFRVGVWTSGNDPWMLEFPGGIVDEGEDAQTAARREALEESGCVISKIEPAMIFYPTPASVNETVHLFVAQFSEATDGSVHGQIDEGEHIRIRLIDLPDALALLETGKIRHGMTIIALQWLTLNHRTLKQKWLKERND